MLNAIKTCISEKGNDVILNTHVAHIVCYP